MTYLNAVLLAFLLSLVTAAPNAKPKYCPQDKCLKAVHQGPDFRIPEIGVSNCYGAFVTTVSACSPSSTIAPSPSLPIISDYGSPGVHRQTSTPAPSMCAGSVQQDVPYWANAECNDLNAYRSACSCLGARHTTTTMDVDGGSLTVYVMGKPTVV